MPCHGVGAVENDEAVITVIALSYYSYEMRPQSWTHVARIYRLAELVRLYLRVYIRKFADILYEVVEVERFQCSCLRVSSHADCAACINKQHALLPI